MSFVLKSKIGAVAVLATSVMGCAHPHVGPLGSHEQPVVEEVVIIEQPVFQETVVGLDCSQVSHAIYKECARAH